jgi:lipid A 4'-phosphatase
LSRKVLLAVVALSTLASLVLAFFPELDLAVSRLFWTEGTGFWMSRYPALKALRSFSMVPTIVVASLALVAVVLKIALPRSKPLMPMRMALFFLTSVLGSTLLLVNVALKEHWDRARPVHVTEFGGHWAFTPWWQPGDGSGCRTNCSFISGEASGAAWLVAPAMVAPPALRPAALVAVAVYTVAVSALRVAFGGHFLSDVLLGAVVTLLITVGCHAWFYRRWGAPDDDVLADRLAAVGFALRSLFARNG